MTFAPAGGAVPELLLRHAARFTRLYILALAAVACLSVLGQSLVQWSLDRQRNDSTLVNIAGRQRMLSQRLCKAALSVEHASSPVAAAAARAEIAETLAQWRQADAALRTGDGTLGLPGRNSLSIQRALSETEPHFRAMKDAAESLLAKADAEPAVAGLLAHEPQFLATMDAAVGQYEREARERVVWLKGMERSLLALTLLVLALEGAFIFRPAVRRIRASASALLESRRQLEAARQQAESASQAKSDFLGMISHELRNPLQAVLGSVELAAHASDAGARQEHLEITAAAARTLLRLLNDLLDLARVEAGTLEILPAPFQPARSIAKVVAMVEPEARARGLTIEQQVVRELPAQLVGDELRLQQLLLNLLGNALKFTPTGGRITLRVQVVATELEQVRLRYEVTDTGRGIPGDMQARIFEPFTQVADVPAQGGVGLGLAICKRLVTQMQGEVGVASEAGQGSTFWFEVSLATVPSSPPLQPCSVKSERIRGLRVLVVDDDPLNRRLLAQLLELLGHSVIMAADGSEALMRIDEDTFDVALLDWQMPGMNGGQLATAIANRQRAAARAPLTLCALSAAIDTNGASRDASQHFAKWLTKPIGLRELRLALDGLSTGEDSPPPAAAASPADLPSRWTTALARLNGQVELLLQLARDFSDGLPALLAALEEACARDQRAEVARLAHLLAGQAANFSAAELVATARRIEESAASSPLPTELLPRLRAQAQNLTQEFRALALRSQPA